MVSQTECQKYSSSITVAKFSQPTKGESRGCSSVKLEMASSTA